MSASAADPSATAPRDRPIDARRAARVHKFERERLIVDCLNRGVSVADIAHRVGVTEKRMRALAKEILARRMPQAPEEFVAVQVSRLNEALLVAYSAMSPGNLKAVALVVRIVRELDRYHGFVALGRRPRRDAPAADADTPAAPRVIRPETAAQPIEKMESAPEKAAVLVAFEETVPEREGSPGAERPAPAREPENQKTDGMKFTLQAIDIAKNRDGFGRVRTPGRSLREGPRRIGGPSIDQRASGAASL